MEGSTRETDEPMAKVLEGIKQLTDSRRHVLHIAVELLETEYEERLSREVRGKQPKMV